MPESDADQTDRNALKVRLRLKAATNSAPVLTDTDLDTIIEECKVAARWQASTAYVVGQIIAPNTRNGHWFKCVQAGTSGTTEPNWLATPALRIRTFAWQVTDGTVIWEECGPDYPSVFDARQAIQNCWLAKAAKASELFDDEDGRLSQVMRHCQEMAERYRPIKLA